MKFSYHSPLDQFEIRNLITLDAPILANLHLSLTNIGLYLTMGAIIGLGATFLAYHKHILEFFINSVPKFHAFVSLPLQCGINLVTIKIGGIIVSIASSYFSTVKNFGIILYWATILSPMAILFVHTVISPHLLTDLTNIINQLNIVLENIDNSLNYYHNAVAAHENVMNLDILRETTINYFIEYESLIETAIELENRIIELDNNYAGQLSSILDTYSSLVNRYNYIEYIRFN